MIDLAKEYFSEAACSNAHITVENMTKVVSRSSMVFMFEKWTRIKKRF